MHYLYNGMEAPDISSIWTGDIKVAFPYVIIGSTISEPNKCFLIATQVKLLEWNNSALLRNPNDKTEEFTYFSAIYDPEVFDGWSIEGYATVDRIGPYTALWTSYPIWTNFGYTFMLATPPVDIPRYEPNLIQGLIVGNILAQQRGKA